MMSREVQRSSEGIGYILLPSLVVSTKHSLYYNYLCNVHILYIFSINCYLIKILIQKRQT
jgi:hypothetical protein